MLSWFASCCHLLPNLFSMSLGYVYLRVNASYGKLSGPTLFRLMYHISRDAYIYLTCFLDSRRSVTCLPNFFLWGYGICHLVVSIASLLCCAQGSPRTCLLFVYAVHLDFQISWYWFMCCRYIVRLLSCFSILVLLQPYQISKVTSCCLHCTLLSFLLLCFCKCLPCVSNGYNCLCLPILALYLYIIVCCFCLSDIHAWCVSLCCVHHDSLLSSQPFYIVSFVPDCPSTPHQLSSCCA